jgi:hypothetical protein
LTAIMSNLLLWLALPLLAIPALARRSRIGAAVGQLIMAGFGLAALHQGAGTLDPGDLSAIARQSPHDAWFVGITAGVLITGACLLPDVRNWRKALLALPLLIGLLVSALPHLFPLAVGLVVGTFPMLLGMLSAGKRSPAGPPAMPGAAEPPAVNDAVALALGGATVLAALLGPAVLAMFGLGALVWREWFRHRSAGLVPRVPVLQFVATLLLLGWTWLVLTIAGSPLPSLLAVAEDAPVSPAAAQGLALVAIGWAVAIAAPWPLDRLTRTSVQLPVVAIVIHFAGVGVVPDGLAHWQPIASSVLVASALVGGAFGRWDGAAAAMVLLAATRGGVIALVGAVGMALAPVVCRTRVPARISCTFAGGVIALVLVGLLRDQVLLSVIVAMGAASLANRTDHLVARGSRHVHL